MEKEKKEVQVQEQQPAASSSRLCPRVRCAMRSPWRQAQAKGLRADSGAGAAGLSLKCLPM
jgi:hypothetical protein